LSASATKAAYEGNEYGVLRDGKTPVWKDPLKSSEKKQDTPRDEYAPVTTRYRMYLKELNQPQKVSKYKAKLRLRGELENAQKWIQLERLFILERRLQYGYLGINEERKYLGNVLGVGQYLGKIHDQADIQDLSKRHVYMSKDVDVKQLLA
jgi:hypothetical protein